MKILVTGCAGFIGTNLCKRLLKEGHSVVGIDHFGWGYEKNMEDIGFTDYYKKSIFDLPPIECIDIIYHQANLRKNVSTYAPALDIETTVNGTRMLLDWALTYGIKKFIYASSSLVYGEHAEVVDENSRLNPICMYGVSKVAAEKLVNMYRREGLQTSIYRYFQGYGPYQDTERGGAIIPTVIKNILRGEPITIYGDGQQTRSFTWIDDIVDILMFPLQNKGFGETFNVTAGIEYKIIDIVELIRDCCAEMDIPVSPIVYEDARADDVKRLSGDNTKLIGMGVSFNTDIKANLKKTIKFYKKWL